MTQFLLEDVVAAGAGIERVGYQLGQLFRKIEGDAGFFGRRSSIEVRAIGSSSVLQAYLEYSNLLTWLYAPEDRVERTWRGTTFGLLPSLAPGELATRVRQALTDLKDKLLDANRPLRNLTTHSSAVPYPIATQADIRAGRVFLRIPDVPRRAIRFVWELSYRDGRDLESFADDVATQTDGFLGRLLSSFERAQPTRLRRPPP